MMRFTSLLSLLILCSFLISCTEDDQANVEAAERQYASLYLAIKHEDRKAAKQSAKQFEDEIQSLGLNWITPNSEGSTDVFRFRLGRAQKAWDATKLAINDDNLALAELQLDRATYEVSVAHPASFDKLQMGKLYPVLSSWSSLVSILEDENYCGFGWEEITRYHTGVIRNLGAAKAVHPLDFFYAKTEAEADQYQRMLGEIDRQLASLLRSINFEDRELILAELDRTDQAINDLLELFSLRDAV